MSSIIRNAGLARAFALALALSAAGSIAAQAAEKASDMTKETSMNQLEQSYDNGVATQIP